MTVERSIRDYVLESFLFTDNDDQLQDSAAFLEEGIVDSTASWNW